MSEPELLSALSSVPQTSATLQLLQPLSAEHDATLELPEWCPPQADADAVYWQTRLATHEWLLFGKQHPELDLVPRVAQALWAPRHSVQTLAGLVFLLTYYRQPNVQHVLQAQVDATKQLDGAEFDVLPSTDANARQLQSLLLLLNKHLPSINCAVPYELFLCIYAQSAVLRRWFALFDTAVFAVNPSLNVAMVCSPSIVTSTTDVVSLRKAVAPLLQTVQLHNAWPDALDAPLQFRTTVPAAECTPLMHWRPALRIVRVKDLRSLYCTDMGPFAEIGIADRRGKYFHLALPEASLGYPTVPTGVWAAALALLHPGQRDTVRFAFALEGRALVRDAGLISSDGGRMLLSPYVRTTGSRAGWFPLPEAPAPSPYYRCGGIVANPPHSGKTRWALFMGLFLPLLNTASKAPLLTVILVQSRAHMLAYARELDRMQPLCPETDLKRQVCLWPSVFHATRSPVVGQTRVVVVNEALLLPATLSTPARVRTFAQVYASTIAPRIRRLVVDNAHASQFTGLGCDHAPSVWLLTNAADVDAIPRTLLDLACGACVSVEDTPIRWHEVLLRQRTTCFEVPAASRLAVHYTRELVPLDTTSEALFTRLLPALLCRLRDNARARRLDLPDVAVGRLVSVLWRLHRLELHVAPEVVCDVWQQLLALKAAPRDRSGVARAWLSSTAVPPVHAVMNTDDCPVCMCPLPPAHTVQLAPCGHLLCLECFSTWVRLSPATGPTCPCCRTPLVKPCYSHPRLPERNEPPLRYDPAVDRGEPTQKRPRLPAAEDDPLLLQLLQFPVPVPAAAAVSAADEARAARNDEARAARNDEARAARNEVEEARGNADVDREIDALDRVTHALVRENLLRQRTLGLVTRARHLVAPEDHHMPLRGAVMTPVEPPHVPVQWWMTEKHDCVGRRLEHWAADPVQRRRRLAVFVHPYTDVSAWCRMFLSRGLPVWTVGLRRSQHDADALAAFLAAPHGLLLMSSEQHRAWDWWMVDEVWLLDTYLPMYQHAHSLNQRPAPSAEFCSPALCSPLATVPVLTVRAFVRPWLMDDWLWNVCHANHVPPADLAQRSPTWLLHFLLFAAGAPQRFGDTPEPTMLAMRTVHRNVYGGQAFLPILPVLRPALPLHRPHAARPEWYVTAFQTRPHAVLACRCALPRVQCKCYDRLSLDWHEHIVAGSVVNASDDIRRL